MKLLWIPHYYDMDHALSRRTFRLAQEFALLGYDSKVLITGAMVDGSTPPVTVEGISSDYIKADIIVTKRLDESLFDRTNAKVILDWNDGDLNCKFLHKYAAVIVGCTIANEVIMKGKGEVIEFPIEASLVKANYAWRNKIVFIGATPGWSMDTINYLRSRGYDVGVIGLKESSFTTDTWERETWQQKTVTADIGIIPYPPQHTWYAIERHIRIKTKDNEKASEFMALGLPTIVAPLNSYSFISHKTDGFIADTREEFLYWVEYIQNYTEEQRKQLGMRARDKALSLFSYPIIVEKYKKLFDRVLRMR